MLHSIVVVGIQIIKSLVHKCSYQSVAKTSCVVSSCLYAKKRKLLNGFLPFFTII